NNKMPRSLEPWLNVPFTRTRTVQALQHCPAGHPSSSSITASLGLSIDARSLADAPSCESCLLEIPQIGHPHFCKHFGQCGLQHAPFILMIVGSSSFVINHDQTSEPTGRVSPVHPGAWVRERPGRHRT